MPLLYIIHAIYMAVYCTTLQKLIFNFSEVNSTAMSIPRTGKQSNTYIYLPLSPILVLTTLLELTESAKVRIVIFMHNMEYERAEISEPQAKLWADQNQWRELENQATVLDMVFDEDNYDGDFELNMRVIEKIVASRSEEGLCIPLEMAV